MRAYISGPMTGLPGNNYPAFNAMAARLRAAGYAVENPAENPPQPSWIAYIRLALEQIERCDAIVFLPGWEQSPGAQIEDIAARRHGLRVILAPDGSTP